MNHKQIMTTLEKNGYSCYIVGGYVRDYLLGKKPKDVDLATSATPQQIKQLFPTSDFVGNCFGITMISGIEVATFRKDVYLQVRKAEVKFTTSARMDSNRRDFTINALYMDNPGKILDFHNGRRDLKQKKLRFVGNYKKRIQEDPVRVLRQLRFSANLGFEIVDPVQAKALIQLSPERIILELKKVKNYTRFFQLMVEHNVLPVLFPSVSRLVTVKEKGDYHIYDKHALDHTEKVIKRSAYDFVSFMIAMLHDTGKAVDYLNHEKESELIAKQICNYYKLSKAETVQIVGVIGAHMRIKQPMKKTKLIKYLPIKQYLVNLALADGKPSGDNLWFLLHYRAPVEPLVRGDDLMKLGIKQGKEMGILLKKIEELSIEGILKSKKDALEFIKRNRT